MLPIPKTLPANEVRFNGGKLEVEGQDNVVQGSIPIHFPFELIEVDEGSVNKISVKLATWVAEQYGGSYFSSFDRLRDFSLFANIHAPDSWWIEIEPEERDTRLLTFSKYAFSIWLLDDVLESQTDDEKFDELCADAGKLVEKALLFPEKNFRAEFQASLLGETPYLFLYNELEIWHILGKDLRTDHAINVVELEMFASGMRYLCECNSWLDYKNGEQLLNGELRKFLRHWTSGIEPACNVFNAMDHLTIPDDVRTNKYVQRFKVVASQLCYYANDLFSIAKEKNKGEFENTLMIYCRQGLSFDVALSKYIKKAQKLATEYQELFEHCVKTTGTSSITTKYIRNYSMLPRRAMASSMLMKRYSDVTWEVVPP